MKFLSKFGKPLVVLMTIACFIVNAGSDLTAEAAKKKKGGPDPAAQAEAELQKSLEPLGADLIKLTMKIEGRGLLSPDEAGQLIELKYKLLDMMNKTPQSELIAKPVYQAGILFAGRESYNDAYELFNDLAQAFPSNPYGAKAKGQIRQLEKRFGADYFSVETMATTETALSSEPGTTKPSSEAKTGKKP